MTAARELIRRPHVYARATLAAVSVALEIRRLHATIGFDQLVARLREGPPFRGGLADPLVHGRVVRRLAPLLPVGMGLCLKRSLILLRLWSRCGLHPQLHLGFMPNDASPWRGHAWLTAALDGQTLACGSAGEFREAFVF